jgi:hypothetical protein
MVRGTGDDSRMGGAAILCSVPEDSNAVVDIVDSKT